MPVLTVDFSRGAASALLINDNLSYKIARFPIVFPNIYYAHKRSFNEILRVFLSMVEEDFKVQVLGKMDVYLATIKDWGIEGNKIHTCLKDDAFKSLTGVNFMYFGHQHVGSSAGIFQGDIDYKEVLRELYFDEKEQTLVNYFENFSIYPFLQPNSDRDFYEEEAYLKIVARKNCKYTLDSISAEPATIQDMIFSTTRDISDELSLCRFMLLCIESHCVEGVFSFKLDQHDFLGAIAPLNLLNKEFAAKIRLPEFLSLGSVININDSVSCKIVTTKDQVHKIDLPKNELFTFPVGEPEAVKVTIKTGSGETIEKTLNGGVFGVVIDTRDKLVKKPLLPDERKKYVKHWETVLVESIKGL